MVEVSDLLAEDKVLEQRWAAHAGFERILVVCDWHALIGGECPSAGIDTNAVERIVAGIDPERRLAVARFSGSIGFGGGASRCRRISGHDRLTRWRLGSQLTVL